MRYKVKPEIHSTETPPISESLSWLPPENPDQTAIILSQAVPNYPPAAELQDHLARLSSLADTSLYTDILGMPQLRQALAEDLSRDYAADLASDNIAITAGGNQAFCLTIMALASAGDNVVLPYPYYFNHKMWLDMLGIEARLLRCSSESAMLPDTGEAEELIDERTRAIVLVSPNNPTGAIYPPALLEQFHQLCRRNDLALVIDETYRDFRENRTPIHHLFQANGWDDAFIHLHSFSKSFALTGYRVGAICAAMDFVVEIEKLMDCVAICAPNIGQEAALFGLNHLDAWRQNKIHEMSSKLNALQAAFARNELAYRLVSSGAFFAYVEHPFEGQSSKQVAMRLAHEHNLLVLPGSMFGPDQERFLRIAFANVPASDMADVVNRLIASQD